MVQKRKGFLLPFIWISTSTIIKSLMLFITFSFFGYCLVDIYILSPYLNKLIWSVGLLALNVKYEYTGYNFFFKLTGGNFEERGCDPSPHIGDSLGEVVGESPLLKGRQTVCDYVADLGQVSEVAAHVYREVSWNEKIFTHGNSTL